MFKQVGNDVDKLSLVFKNFHTNYGLFGKSFANIGTDFKNGHGIRSLTNFVSKADVENFNKFNTALQQGTNYSKAFETHLSKSHTFVQKKAVEVQKLRIQQDLLNNQLHNGKITQEQYNTAMAANKAQMTALTTGTQKLTLAQKASAVASKALGTALNLALNVGFMLIINAIITGITKLVNKQKELRESIAETAQEAKEETDNLKELIKSYEEFADKTSYTAEEKERLAEIQQKLVDTYHFEAEGIDLVNGKYDEEIAKLKELQREKLKDAKRSFIAEREQATQEVFNKSLPVKTFNIQDEWFNADDYEQIVKELDERVSGFSTSIGLLAEATDWKDAEIFFNGTQIEDRVNQIKETMDILEEYGYTHINFYSQLNEALSEYQGYLDTYDEATLNLADNMFQSYELDNPFSQVGQDSYLAWRDGLLKSANGDADLQAVLSDLTRKQFPDYAEYFNNLAKARQMFVKANSASDVQSATNKDLFLSTLSPENLKAATQIPDLFEDGIEEAYRKIAEFLNSNPIEVSADILSFEEIQKKYEELTNAVSDFTSTQKTLNDALEEQKEHGQLSASTIQSLTETGYAQVLVIDAETGAVTPNVTEYEKLNAEKKKQIQLDIAKLKVDLLNPYKEEALAIAELEKSLASLSAEERKATNAKIAQMKASMASMELSEEERKQKEQELALLEAQLAILDAPTFDSGSGKKEDPDQVKKFLAEYNEKRHKIAIGEMVEDQDYYDWLASAAEKAYAGLKDYEEDLWKYQEEVYEGRKQLADDYLNDRIEDREAQIEITLDTSKADDGTKLNTKEKFDYVRDCYREILAEIETRINDLVQSGVATNSEAIQELEKQAQEYRDKLDGVLTDEIETEIDYLKNMQDKWDKVYDDKIDAIEKEKSAMEERYDSEIDKIDEQIDALQKTNDEKQRELDIEKAKQELAKASQRTRKVYGSDGTVEYRHDDEAKKDAQKKLDDLLLEQVIDNLEAEKENLEKNKELETKQFEEQIELQKQEQTAKQEFYNKLLEILENYLNPKATESNSNVWESVLGDTENVKKSNGNVEVKGADVDTSSLKKGILNSVDIINWLEKLGASADIIKAYVNGTGNTTTMAMQTSMNNTASKQFDNQHKTSAWSASRDDYKLASANQNENITYAIGDIHIHNPVGNSNDLAAEFAKHLTLAIHKQTYTNLKK